MRKRKREEGGIMSDIKEEKKRLLIFVALWVKKELNLN